MQILSSICQNHFFYRSTTTGVLLRGGLITAIYDRSLRLTTRARTTLTNGKLVNHISTDVSRIDFCCGFFHLALTAPIQMVICLILLILNLGPSALAGFAFFVLCTPVQTSVMRRLMMVRQKSMAWTDKRAKLLQELLGGMKIIKFFAWETPYLKRIGEYRANEIGFVSLYGMSHSILTCYPGIFERFWSFVRQITLWQWLCLSWHPCCPSLLIHCPATLWIPQKFSRLSLCFSYSDCL